MSLSSLGLDPGSGSLTPFFTSNSRALTMTKQTFSEEIVNANDVTFTRIDT
jgi:hypothetical protein